MVSLLYNFCKNCKYITMYSVHVHVGKENVIVLINVNMESLSKNL